MLQRIAIAKAIILLMLLLLLCFGAIATVASAHVEVYWIAYIGIPPQSSDMRCSGLCIARSDGSEIRQLSDDIRRNSPLAWSPDGDWIGFVNRKGDLTRLSLAHPDEKYVILTGDQALSLAGVNSQTIENFHSLGNGVAPAIEDVIWSSDGESLYITIREWIGMAYSPADIFRIDLDGNLVQRLTTHGESFIFGNKLEGLSPDGDLLVFLEVSLCRYCDFYGGDIHLINTATGELLRLDDVKSGRSNGDPVFSHAGDRIYFIHEDREDHTLSLHFVSSDGAERSQIADELVMIGRVNVAATQRYVYVVGAADEFGCGSVQILDIETGDDLIVLNEQGICYQNVAAMPVGDVVALSGAMPIDGGGDGLYLMYPDGEREQLINGYQDVQNPIWSPVPIFETTDG